MKEITLASGQMVRIEASSIQQAKQMTELVAAGHPMEATVKFCVDSMNRAGSSITIEEFESTFSIPEANELFERAVEVSALGLGEKKASD